MRVVLFTHSIVSDWGHNHAHFLRGVISELRWRGHEVRVFEPAGGWSILNLVRDHGVDPIRKLRDVYPGLDSTPFDLDRLDLDQTLDGADLVLVHESSEHELIRRIGHHRARARNYTLLFHDTHHRGVTDPMTMNAYDLSHYDGALVNGVALHEMYRRHAWAERVWTWHEAADVRVFQPLRAAASLRDVVWIGNFHTSDERIIELGEMFMEPVRALGLAASAFGARFPDAVLQAFDEAGIYCGGWVANYDVPQIYGEHRVALHVARRPRELQHGLPSIRMFEALACGIPLVCGPLEDEDQLFVAGRDYLLAPDAEQMKRTLRSVLHDRELADSLAQNGLNTITQRHTCAHRVNELYAIHRAVLGAKAAA